MQLCLSFKKYFCRWRKYLLSTNSHSTGNVHLIYGACMHLILIMWIGDFPVQKNQQTRKCVSFYFLGLAASSAKQCVWHFCENSQRQSNEENGGNVLISLMRQWAQFIATGLRFLWCRSLSKQENNFNRGKMYYQGFILIVRRRWSNQPVRWLCHFRVDLTPSLLRTLMFKNPSHN